MATAKGVTGIVLVLMALGLPAAGGSSDVHTVRVGFRTLKLDATAWRPMANEATFAENFEAVTVKSGETWPQVITIFKLPMSSDRKRGIQVTKSEYVEPFVAHPGKVTIQIAVDRGRYWVQSRQTFDVASDVAARVAWDVDVSTPRPRNSAKEQRSLVRVFQDQVDSTRAWINVNL
jgi:hypothetical protein